jgi:hypothetical protein
VSDIRNHQGRRRETFDCRPRSKEDQQINFQDPTGGAKRTMSSPDSDKIMVRWGPEPSGSLWFRLQDAADYWEGEEKPS